MAQENTPLSIIGVVSDEVGSPRNDGSRGSGLYAVPIALNRRPTADEAELLVAVWDRPPSYTTMHRHGILRVTGDRLVLDGTTVDEVAQYHAKTLKLVVDAVNGHAEVRRRERAEARARDEAAAEAHRLHVEEVAKRITFE